MHDRLHPDAAPEAASHQTIAAPPQLRRPIYVAPISPFGPAFAIFGIFLPLITLFFELSSHACGETFFDPIPTWWHVALVALVPLSNSLVWLRLMSTKRRPARWHTFIAGAAIGVTVAYSLVFLPMTPLAIVGVVFGIGVLPLTPLIALCTTARAWNVLARAVPGAKVLPGLAAGFLALGIPFAWDRATDALINRAVASEGSEQASAVQWLRRVGSESRLLQRCYLPARRVLNPFTTIDELRGEDFAKIRAIHYRVTGVPFNHHPAPMGVALPGAERRFNWDSELGGERVGGKIAGLTLETSQLETLVNKTDLTAYSEWTFVFRNAAANASEARAEIELPPNGVVSRVTLWIDGEPREAAFGTRAQVRAAYKEVAVVQRRDPILVTTSGLDRVLMQCFPVPPRDGEMKVRIGITAPIEVIEAARGQIATPRVVETNFAFGRSLRPSFAMRHAAGDTPQPQPFSETTFGNGAITSIELGSLAPVWCEDPLDAEAAILQSPRIAEANPPGSIVYVVDGSANLRDQRKQLREAFATPAARVGAVFFAGDSVERWPGEGNLGDWLASRAFAGGSDNQAALRAAWIEAAQSEDSAVVWIHGPQPVAVTELDANWSPGPRAKSRPPIYAVAAKPGPNHIMTGLGELPWRRAPRAESLRGSLDQLWQTWSGARPAHVLERTRISRAQIPPNTAPGSRHIARLWANEEVNRQIQKSALVEDAAKLAARMQLVTPLTGAVVLERAAQYRRHNLEPVGEETVPAIPEPASTTLLAASAALLALKRRRAASRR